MLEWLLTSIARWALIVKQVGRPSANWSLKPGIVQSACQARHETNTLSAVYILLSGRTAWAHLVKPWSS